MMTELVQIALRPFALAALAGMTAFAAPVSAQTSGDEKVRFVTVVGEEQCPESTDDEIVVCNRYNQDEQFRVPTDLRGNPDSPENRSWTSRVETMEEVSESGAQSCSPTGLGGFTGCTQEMIEAYYANKDRQSAGRASEIINATRAERLSDVDAEAEAEEARVQEAIERQRQLREGRSAPVDGAAADDGAGAREPLATPDEELMNASPE